MKYLHMCYRGSMILVFFLLHRLICPLLSVFGPGFGAKGMVFMWPCALVG